MYLSKNIVELRKKRGLTLKQLEKISGIAFSSIARIERGERKEVTIQTVIKLAKAFEVSLDDLVLKDLTTTDNMEKLPCNEKGCDYERSFI